VTNPSNIYLIHHLMAREGVQVRSGCHYFTVVGEYYTEAFREKIATMFAHSPEEPFVVWTGYGSADTGDLGVETRSSIRLRKFFFRHPQLCSEVFGEASPPMLLEASSSPHLEIVDGRIVVTKDQMVPLVRYDTGDDGGLLQREQLADLPGLPPDLLEALPSRLLFVRGRASDAVIFYGTNLKVGDISDHLLALPAGFGYAGFFELRRREKDGISTFTFTIYVEGAPTASRAFEFQANIVDYLKGCSLEFSAKYDALSQSVGFPLIEVELKPIASKDIKLKHRYLVEE
jgi:phenylacetate-CoA ligase